MESTNITVILETAFTLIMLIITSVLVPLIKNRIEDEKFGKIMTWVKIAVQAAEMIYKESGMGAEKKAYVLQFLRSKGYSIDEVSLDNMIESAVLELKNAVNN